ncbi:MAG: M1 family metallopeptidase [Chloroflexi bacterium]|nr:M1 family metallopeptidase [Chloroflexota bacterium]
MTQMSNYALRLQASLLNELRRVAKEEGTSINQFINIAVAEKLAALRTERYFRERMKRARPEDFIAILEKAGTDITVEGDELPVD